MGLLSILALTWMITVAIMAIIETYKMDSEAKRRLKEYKRIRKEYEKSKNS